MTATATLIVTAIGQGNVTARAIADAVPSLSHANVRQSLRRMAKAGAVTITKRGSYGLPLGCDSSEAEDNDDRRLAARIKRDRPDIAEAVERGEGMAALWADFEAMDDPYDERAWA